MMRNAMLITVYWLAHASASIATAADEDGFTTIFDGKSLDGWHVVPPERKSDWSVRDGLLVGSSDGKGSNLIWKADDVGDFELKLRYRFRTPGNSGIHIRGRLGESKSHRVKGYHADLGHVGIGPKVLGAWDFHGTPRGDNLVNRGQRVTIDERGRKSFTAIQNPVTPQDIRKRDWNEMHVVARGHRFYFTINGKMASEVIDNEAANRIDRGVIGLQLHGGPRMTIQFRGIRLKRLKPGAEPLRVGTFDVDASPPVGSPMAYDPTKGVQTPLSCRGVVLAGARKPIVLCAVDWIGISNGGQTVFRESLAAAAGTEPERVAVHTLHQHDAPRCDFAADELLKQYGLGGAGFDPVYARDVVRRAAAAVKMAMDNAKPVTHLGIGSGIVEQVASNRRILGPDGKVKYTRWTATKDPKIRAFPVGTIDPELKLISFWNGDEPIAALTYYATHPQSYYRTGLANPDFPGLARNARQKETGVPHIHFNGAGGNIGAGKWNDGSKENRQVLADRVLAGMKRAWDNTKKSALSVDDVGWSIEPVVLPVAEHLDEDALMKTLNDRKAKPSNRYFAARNLIWLRRCRSGDTIDISCLRLENARVLHMPGELFVEYQLSAQKHRPDLFVAMAAYGDYAPGYIGTEIAYSQGGYETSPGASKVAPEVEGVLMGAIQKLLGTKPQ